MPKDLLGQAALDVPADSSPAGEAAPVAATEPSDGGGKKKNERTIDEVRGELVRKIEEANSTTREMFARLEGMLSARQAEPARPAGAPDIAVMSADQLEAMRPNVPKEQMAAFDKMVSDRRMSETVRGIITSEFSQREAGQAREAANREAFARYPDLHNESSQMRKMTNRVLEERGGLSDARPQAVLDAANEAASRLGVAAVRQGSGGSDMRQPGSRSAPAPDGKPKGPSLAPEKADAIARALRHALPPGKTFNMERIQKAHAEYNEHRALVIKQ